MFLCDVGRAKNDGKATSKNLEWYPSGRRRIEGRPRNSWMQEVTPGTREKEINSMEWSIGKNTKGN